MTLPEALAPAFAAGFALQRAIEIADAWLGDSPSRAPLRKKALLGTAAFGLGLALALLFPEARILSRIRLGEVPAQAAPIPFYLDVLISALVVSAGTEGFNSILKFISYKKEETKADAAEKARLAGTSSTASGAKQPSLRLPEPALGAAGGQ